MSILSSQSQGSTSSSSSSFGSPSQNPNPDYGNKPPSPPSPLSSFSAGHLASAANDSGGSSEGVTEIGTPNASGSSVHQNDDALPLTNNTGRQGVRSARSKGKMSRSIDPPRSQLSTGSINSLGGSTNSSGRRAQMTNANHLLNFHYDPIARSQPKPLPPPRRQQKVKPYNRDLFLQANYKFVVLDTGNYSPESMDPDKMLRWEDIICVRYSTPSPVQCPICLEPPLCPQITSCGHIFCFPCILRYLQMGEEDHKGDCFKRCPLCFVLVSQKDLYTIYIESVNQYSVGDTIEFMLLTREKDSFAPSQKNKLVTDAKPSCIDDIYDPFSKFTFTSDVDLSVRKAISDLDGWLARADSGLVDDLEKLPYVCAAMGQLEHRKKYWNEQRVYDKNASYKHANNHKGSQERLSAANATNADEGVYISEHVSLPIDLNDRIKTSSNVIVDVVEALEGGDVIFSSSYDEKKSSQGHSNDSRDVKERDSYNFYQAADGQHLIVHPINMKCLLHHYGGYDMLPHRIGGTILQLETVTQSEAMRRRYRYLSHFSLTTTFQLCEIDLSEILPPDALIPFIDEIKKREKQRKQLAKKERKEKIKAEASAADTAPILYGFGQSHHADSPTFSMDDFEALGSSTAMSSSPPIAAGRMLFSNVTRLGFAAAHDSPGLRIEDTSAQQKLTNDSSSGTGSSSTALPSFANVISSAKSVDNVSAPKVNETGKKGKKPSRVLMSTAGGRRY